MLSYVKHLFKDPSPIELPMPVMAVVAIPLGIVYICIRGKLPENVADYDTFDAVLAVAFLLFLASTFPFAVCLFIDTFFPGRLPWWMIPGGREWKRRITEDGLDPRSLPPAIPDFKTFVKRSFWSKSPLQLLTYALIAVTIPLACVRYYLRGDPPERVAEYDTFDTVTAVFCLVMTAVVLLNSFCAVLHGISPGRLPWWVIPDGREWKRIYRKPGGGNKG